jgi:hypothetical protein
MRLNANGNSSDRINNVMNLIATDGTRLNELAFYAMMLIISPLIIIATVVVLVNEVSFTLLGGLLLLALAIPIQTSLNTLLVKIRQVFCRSLQLSISPSIKKLKQNKESD